MATKTITITIEGYERLARLKEPKESFSDVIYKLTLKSSWFDVVDLLSHDHAEALRASVRETRKELERQVHRRAARLRWSRTPHVSST